MDEPQIGKPSQASEESDAEAYRRQQAIKTGAFGLAGVSLMSGTGKIPAGSQLLRYAVKHPDTGELREFGLEYADKAADYARRLGTQVLKVIWRTPVTP